MTLPARHFTAARLGLTAFAALVLWTAPAGPAVAKPFPEQLPARSPGDVAPVHPPRSFQAPALSTTDTITVFHADLENLSSPGNEGGWTHVDKSGIPTAWHIAPNFACQGHAFWCGLVDSTWTGDPDRSGYDNNWVQTLQNYVDLTGASSPVKMGFKHSMNLEPGYDFGILEVFDPVWDWIPLATFTGQIPNGSALCDTFNIQIPDSIIAKNPVVSFRFLMQTDLQGSSADGLYPAAKGWVVDNVSVQAQGGDLRFFDDMESGMGTWTVSTFPPVGDFWRITNARLTQALCNSDTSQVWSPADPSSGSLVARMDDQLVSPPVATGGAAQVFLGFDVYRNLPFSNCMYYSIGYRSRKAGLPWSGWLDPTGLLYYGNENEWLRQTVTLPGAAGSDSVQVRLEAKDYAAIFCDGVSSAAGTRLYFDNLDVRTLASSGPSLATSETSLLNDTFSTTAFFGDDNFNTPRGDSTTVRIGASRGLKRAMIHRSFNGAPFDSTALTPVGVLAPDIWFGDVPAGAYPRGTTLRYYFSATDSTDASATLPIDAWSAGHYFTAAILPASFTPTSACPTDSARVLYVNDYAGPGAVTGVDQSLAALGVRYDRFDVNGASTGFGNTPGGGDPATGGPVWPAVSPAALATMYSAIIWDVGERSSLTLSAQDQTLLSSWLATAGKDRNLILAGDNLAYDMTTNGADIGSFLSCSVGASFGRDIWETTPQDTLTPNLTGASGTRIALEWFPLVGTCPDLNHFDALSVSPCIGAAGRAWLVYPNGLLAGTERRAPLGTGTDSLRAVMLGFSLGSMQNTTRRNYLLWRTLVEEMRTPYCTTPTGIEAAIGAPPAHDRLDTPAPNPFNPSTTIRFAVARAGPVRVIVYNVAGARVRTLLDRAIEAGEHTVRWDGKDDHGRDVGSAAYFIRMSSASGSTTRKAVLLR
ncbi:MAG: FlgD immunoglobulin-like domain containing protein [Bacteroidota bacterium]